MNRLLLLLALLSIGATSCSSKKSDKRPHGIGKAVAETPSRNPHFAAGGKHVVFVGEVGPPLEKDVPEGIFQGVLTVATLDGSAPPRQLGGGVSTLDDGFRVSSDGVWVAFLQGFHFRDQTGTLDLARVDSGEAKQIALESRFFRFSPDGKQLGYIAAGDLHLLELATSADRVIVRQAATFEYARDSQRMLVRQPHSAGGALLLADAHDAAEPRKLGNAVGEYEFSPDGKLVAFTSRMGGPGEPYTLFVDDTATAKAVEVGKAVSAFLFSPDSRWIAFIDGLSHNKELGTLAVSSVLGGEAHHVGVDVVEQRWAPSSGAIAFRESHEDKQGRKWIDFKVAEVPTMQVKTVGDRVPNFAWSNDGSQLAFLRIVVKPEPWVYLMLYKVGEEKPKTVDKGVFSYQFAPGDKALWFRTNCVREARECDLMSVGPDGAGPPVKLVQGIWNFRPNASGERMLITYARTDTVAAADLGVYVLGSKTTTKGIDQYTLPGAQFLDAAGTRVGYVVTQRKREGVYLAEVPLEGIAAPAPSVPKP